MNHVSSVFHLTSCVVMLHENVGGSELIHSGGSSWWFVFSDTLDSEGSLDYGLPNLPADTQAEQSFPRVSVCQIGSALL